MRVLAVSANRSNLIMPAFPLGLSWVSSALKAAGHDVRLLDLRFSERPRRYLAEVIRAFNPDLVGVSLRNIDNQDMLNPLSFVPEASEVVRVVKAVSDIPVVLGGSGFSIFPASCMREIAPDFGVAGEGELSLPMLLRVLEGRGRLEEVPGLLWREGDELRQNPMVFIEDMGELPVPDHMEVDLDLYWRRWGTEGLPGLAAVQTRRGCDRRCIYCSTPGLEDRRLRLRPREAVMEEVGLLTRGREDREIHFVDSLFNIPVKYSAALCGDLSRHCPGIRWRTTYNPSVVDEELIALMARAGCRLVMLGNESGCDAMLENLGKGFHLDKVREAVRLIRGYGMRLHLYLLLSGPGETRESVAESLRFLEQVSPDYATICVGIRI
ncbi:MAG: B12-binding domain-containing radical SAM protein, partial [Actinomycetota bacterium]